MESSLLQAYNPTSILTKDMHSLVGFCIPMFSLWHPNPLTTPMVQPEVVVHPKLNRGVRLDEDGRGFDLSEAESGAGLDPDQDRVSGFLQQQNHQPGFQIAEPGPGASCN